MRWCLNLWGTIWPSFMRIIARISFRWHYFCMRAKLDKSYKIFIDLQKEERWCEKGVGRVQIPVLLQRNGLFIKGVQWNLQQAKGSKSTSKTDLYICCDGESSDWSHWNVWSKKSHKRTCQTHKYRFILIVVDTFSKYCRLYQLIDMKAINVANMLQHIFVANNHLHSDNGKQFTAKVVQHLCHAMNIKVIHNKCTPCHPQTQRQVESLNKKVKETLKHWLLDFRPEEQVNLWQFLLPEIRQSSTWHVTLKCTPFWKRF